MIKNSVENIKKFQFFEEIHSQPPEEILKDLDEKEELKKPLHKQRSNISLNSVSPSGSGQMAAFNGVLFINGKAIHSKDGKMVRESLIMKVIGNKVIDEYRVFNGVYYDFQIKYYNDMPLFIVVGGNFNQYVIEGRKELFMTTSIKIYNATEFINKPQERYPLPEKYGPTDEPYPRLLLKQIKLLKKVNTGELVCDADMGTKMDGYESFQNIIAFSVDNNLSHAAIGLDKGEVILITGYPSLLECSNKDMKMMQLQKIIPKDREIHITNLAFTEMIINKEVKRVLYTSTASSLYYYIWKYDEDKRSQEENNILLKEIEQDGKGAYCGCLAVKDNLLLVASSNEDFIAEYQSLDFGETWFLDGKKNCVKYFKEYILYVVYAEKTSSLQVFDRNNKFFVYFSEDAIKIISVCYDTDCIYVFLEQNDKKRIIKLREKDNNQKFDIFFKKSNYELAENYAQSLNYEKTKICEIYKKHAEYEFAKGNYSESIKQYIKTINFLEPTFVIQKFLDKSKLKYLISYLEALEKDKAFKAKGLAESKDYTTLLLNCYIMEEKLQNVKDFIFNRNLQLEDEIIRTAIDVCIEAGNNEYALEIARKKKLYIDYLQILIIKLGRLKEALDFIEPSSEGETQIEEEAEIKMKETEEPEFIPIDMKINIFTEFGEYFLKSENSMIQEFYNRIVQFAKKNLKKIQHNDLIKLIKIFVCNESFFKKFFEEMINLNINMDENLIHRRIELFLEEENSERDTILEILDNKEFQEKNLFDYQYLLLLFKYKDYPKGIEKICKILSDYTPKKKVETDSVPSFLLEEEAKAEATKPKKKDEEGNIGDLHYRQELLSIYMEQKKYQEIIELCSNFGYVDPSFWGIVLNYFVDAKIREVLVEEELAKIDAAFEQFLDTILVKKPFLPTTVLDLIQAKNEQIPVKILRKFMNSAILNANKQIDMSLAEFNDNYAKMNQINKEIEQMEKQAKTYTLNTEVCQSCRSDISFPLVAFKCGHAYHAICLNANVKNPSGLECRKCREDKAKFIESKVSNDKFFNLINSQEQLKKYMEEKKFKKEDAFNDLFGKNLLRLGKVDEEKN